MTTNIQQDLANYKQELKTVVTRVLSSINNSNFVQSELHEQH